VTRERKVTEKPLALASTRVNAIVTTFPNLAYGGPDLAPRSIPDHYVTYVHESVVTHSPEGLIVGSFRWPWRKLEAKTGMSSR
jgi:hypothetical protein